MANHTLSLCIWESMYNLYSFFQPTDEAIWARVICFWSCIFFLNCTVVVFNPQLAGCTDLSRHWQFASFKELHLTVCCNLLSSLQILEVFVLSIYFFNIAIDSSILLIFSKNQLFTSMIFFYCFPILNLNDFLLPLLFCPTVYV